MKLTLSIVCVLATGTAALAQTGPTTQQMSCSQAAGLVQARGAVVLRTSPTTYDRYVSGGSACPYGQMPAPAWVATADSAQCFIGYRCRDVDLEIGQ